MKKSQLTNKKETTIITIAVLLGIVIFITVINGLKTEPCKYIDVWEVQYMCEKQYPNAKHDFCVDASSHMYENMPNRLRTKKCYNHLTKSEQDEFWAMFTNGIKYATERAYWRSHRY